MQGDTTFGQLPELIYIDDMLYSLFTTPLVPWLRAQTAPIVFDRRSPKCERGYIGKWAIDDGALWLIGLYAWSEGKYTGVPTLFGDRHVVQADWFSGPLIVEPTSSSIREGEYPKPKTYFIEDGQLRDG
ncbi:MAG: hypothetical protein AAF415_17680 [Pseudomonadota bacterium]